MADNILETRILLRYGTYTQWMNSSVILKVGEAAVAAFPNTRTIVQSNSQPENTPPAIGIKIGDGIHYFSELPWVQAVAADVFNWAKASTKPTYTASEIQGLKAFIEENMSSGGEFTIAPRIYQIVEGTNDNANKYYLQYKEDGDNEWTIDTNHYIDLTDLQKILNWIYAANLTNYPSLANFTRAQASLLLSSLNVTDTARTNYFVTSVSENSGIISVTRAQPSFSNISGVVSVSQGGLGTTTLPTNSVLIGNGTGQILTRPIATEITSNTDIVPNYLIKAYVDSAVEGLAGAMHFIGEATVVINTNSTVDPRIAGYNFSQAQPGDVILYEAKEYVWTGGVWRLLGDEGSYAVKGSIKDADIDVEADIAQSKIAGLIVSLNSKVDKEEGKILTSNDFTNELKLKLNGISPGAQVNTIENILLNNVRITPTTIDGYIKAVNLEISEFDLSSRIKLNGIEAGANVNTIESIIYDGNTLIPDNKVITITPNHHPEHENKIEAIFLNEREWRPNADKEVHITLDQAALNLNVLEGAQIPPETGNTMEEVQQLNKKLQLNRIAVTANVKELRQTADTYIVLDCGTSNSDSHSTS